MSTLLLSSLPDPVAPPRMTVEEFTARYQNAHAELVKGVVKEYPMPFPKHGKICSLINRQIGNHVETHDLGHVMGNDSFIRTGPDSVRGADVCFFSYERLPKGPVPEGLLPVSPDLVVEVKSPPDRWGELFGKVSEYLKAGVRVVVVIDPATATVSLYRDEGQHILKAVDELTLPDVLPGFHFAVSRLFE